MSTSTSLGITGLYAAVLFSKIGLSVKIIGKQKIKGKIFNAIYIFYRQKIESKSQ
jgi:hypothetical protein